MKPFLPDDEQRLYDSIVHGLRSQGWSRFDAEGEAIARVADARDCPRLTPSPNPESDLHHG